MKKIFFTAILSVCSYFSIYGQTQLASCKVIETGNHRVMIEFSKEAQQLSSDYTTKILRFQGKRIKFSDGQEAVKYLSSSEGWVLCGEPISLKNGSTMWTLKHEVSGGIANSAKNVRDLEDSANRSTQTRYRTY